MFSMSSQEDIRSAGTIGFIGGILALIPYIDFVGLIMVLIALYKLSHDYGNEGIWRNAIYAVVFSIIGVAIATFTLVGSLSLLSSISYSTIGGCYFHNRIFHSLLHIHGNKRVLLEKRLRGIGQVKRYE